MNSTQISATFAVISTIIYAASPSFVNCLCFVGAIILFAITAIKKGGDV